MKRSSKPKWFENGSRNAFFLDATLPPVTPDASARVCDSRLWRGSADGDTGDMTGVTSATRHRLPCKVSHLQRLDKVRHSGDHSSESDVPLCDGLHLRIYSLFLWLGWSTPRIQHPACAQVAYELMWNEQSKGDQSEWYSSARSFSLRMSAW